MLTTKQYINIQLSLAKIIKPSLRLAKICFQQNSSDGFLWTNVVSRVENSASETLTVIKIPYLN